MQEQSPRRFRLFASWSETWLTIAVVAIVAGALPSAQGQLPAGWIDFDVGSVGMPGYATFDGVNWTVAGGGNDIWNSADAFHFACEDGTDNEIAIAQVTAQDFTDVWAKAGVMFRDSGDPSSTFAMVVATPANGVNFQWRKTFGGGCGGSQVAGIYVPVWVKLVRVGNQFTAFYSPDGAAWTPIGPSENVPMSAAPLVGMCVTAHNNGALNASTFSNVSVTDVPPPPPPVFGVYRQLWTGLDPSAGNNLQALTNGVYNPTWPDFPNPAYTTFYTDFETDRNTGMNYYGQRLRAFVVPPINGPYSFWIASDDSSELLVSTDESEANKVPVAWVSTSANYREWTRETNQQSAPLMLEAGRRYYIEALMQQGAGNDNLSVRWHMPNGIFEEPLPASSSSGTRLIPCKDSVDPPGIYQSPTNTSVGEGLNATFWLLVTNQSPATYQWFVNGSPLASRKPFCTVSNVSFSVNNGQAFTCLVSNSVGVLTSAPAILTVIRDTTPPTVARVFNAGLSNVEVLFSERVDPASATNLANYAFTNHLGIARAVLEADGATITLVTAPLVYGSNYTLVINGVKDRASAPNTIAANTTRTFLARPYTSQDIGNPALASTTIVLSNGLDVFAAGSDIGGYADQLSFSFQTRAGDFDVGVRLAGLTGPDVWAKAGLMARESLDAQARFAATLATPAMNGCFFEWRDPFGAQAGQSGAFPVNYPYTWLRLKRQGNTFSGFAGYDGNTWALLGSAIISMPSQVYFGLALDSHSPNLAAQAQFRDVIDLTNSTLAVIANPHELPGPSSRKTPLVFSEIMYKPAPRADTNNLEFIELYNSNPWFEDLSGYRLVASGMTYTFPPGVVLNGGAYLVVAASPQAIRNVYSITNVLGPYAGSLKKTDTLQLLDEQGAVLLTVPYASTSPWPVAALGTGHSLVLSNPTYGEEDPRAWDISDSVGGSPGHMDGFRPSPLRNVLINEFLAHTDPPDYDYIELYNHANQPVDVSGCILTDDSDTNKFIIPAGTTIPARGFLYFTETTLHFALSAAGEAIYLKSPDQSRYLDAVQFGGQENGVATGRWPDGAPEFYRLSAKTPGTSNASIRPGEIVINELMYHPLSENDDDQYIELYNRTANTVNLGGWDLSGGITFVFPSNVVMAPDSYLVIARNASHLRSNYSNLNLANCIGDFAGKLSHNGEYLALSKPDSIVSTNTQGVVSTNLIHIVVNDLTYGTGGRWGQWSAGGGSSLELIDPQSNNRLAANWADSDETQKAPWGNIEHTGVLDNGANYDSFIHYAQIGLLDSGECLVDNVEVRAGTVGTNLVTNPDFETGVTNWSLQGDHSRSSWENSGFSSLHSLHLRASDRMWTGDNSCQVALYSNTLNQDQTATLRFKARWLRGWPEVLFRLNGNWLEATGRLPVPSNLGTPGARNSRAVTNAGPAIYQVRHTPALPDINQPVLVTARAHDPDGVQSIGLFYRVDPTNTYASLPMKDDGTGGDMVAGDGVFSAVIPGQPGGTLVAFYLAGTDSKLAYTRFPAISVTGAPPPECVVMFGDSNPVGSFPVYHLWVTETNATRWHDLADMSNEAHDCTMVSGNRVIYNVQARFAGSPYHQGFDYPDGSLCHYKWVFPDDDKFLGATSFNKLHQPGNGAGDDASIQREQIANTFLRTLGVPWLYRHHVAVYVNGNRRGTLMEDAQTPDADVVKEHFPQDADGWLYKMQPWFEFGPFPQGVRSPFANESWCNLMPYTTTAGAKKTARYRYNFLIRRTPTSANDFTNIFSLVDAASAFGAPDYARNLENLADMENWMRVFAANHAAGNWDAYGCQNAQNLYGYIGALGTRYTLMMFDFNIVLGNSGSWGPGQNLFAVNGQDPNTQNFYNEPTFRRMYWRALQELMNGPLDIARSGPLMDAKYAAFAANGLNVEDPNSSIKPWLTAARNSIAAQLAGENASAFSLNPVVTISNNVAYVTGTAPVSIKTLLVNGLAYPVTWLDTKTFQLTVPLKAGSNPLSVVGIDMHGQPVPGASNSVPAFYRGTVPSPAGQVVFNEIMFQPAARDAEFVELYNNSTNITFDLSGWQLRGLAYTFPPGATMGPNSFLVLAANGPAFAAAYGADIPVFDTFTGALQNDGETLSLLIPGTNSSLDVIVSRVKYSAAPPWPGGANGGGASLQLIDPRQDNWRVANWSVARANPPGLALATPGASNSVYTALLPFPPLWLNELQADNLTGITNAAGQRTPWLELYNPGTNFVGLGGLCLANNYTNLAQWAFPSNAVISPREFKIIFADGQVNLSTTNEVHTSFILPSGAGHLALSRLATNGTAQVLDYIDYTNLGPNHSYGSFPDGQAFTRQDFVYPTPAGTNNGSSAPLSVAINEWMAGNTHTIPNPLSGKFSDWFELYNYGSSAADLTGYYLTDDLTNRFKFQIPSGYILPAQGFLMVWADGKSTNGTPDLHVTFKLSKSGGSIALYGGDGRPVDAVTYGPQTDDVSMGRFPDGSGNIYTLPVATPDAANIGPNSAPAVTSPGDQYLYAGQTLQLAIQASDPELQPLAFGLGSGAPPGASIDPITGVLTWTPAVPLTNQITVIATDNGTPPLSGSAIFTVSVLPPPSFAFVNLTGTALTLRWSTVPGRVYRLQYTDDLKAPTWTSVSPDQAGTGAVISFILDTSGATRRFYRLTVF